MRGGGGGGFSGGHIGGSAGGMHVGGGGYGGVGYRGGGYGGYHGGGGYYGRGYYGRGYYGSGYYYGGWGWPYWGLGFGYGYGYWPGYYDYGYDYYPSYSYSYPAYSYPAYQPASNVTVVYPQTAQAAPTTVYANPVLRQYDEYGQELQVPKQSSNGASGSPLYLIAFRDQSIRAAIAYWVDGRTLHYVTQQHEERQAPLDSIDRDTSVRLNRERRVAFSLPVPTQQQ